MPQKKAVAKYLFDLYAVLEALNSGNNLIRNTFITGLNSGIIKLPKSVSKELLAVDPDAYEDFQSIKTGRVYIDEGARHQAVQSALMDTYGTTIFGGSPRASSFSSIAVCTVENLDLVTHGRPHGECCKIVKRCSNGKPSVLSLSEFAAAA